jgi:transcription initiation factor TFIID subunit 5
MLKQIS